MREGKIIKSRGIIWKIPLQLHRFSFITECTPHPLFGRSGPTNIVYFFGFTFCLKYQIVEEINSALGVLPSFPVQANDVVVNNVEGASEEESQL